MKKIMKKTIKYVHKELKVFGFKKNLQIAVESKVILNTNE